MRILISIILLTLTLSAQIPPAYRIEAQKWWNEATQSQKDNALWYARQFGIDVGSKTILETSGGANTDHGDEKSERDLGANASLYAYRSNSPALQNWLDNTGIVLPIMDKEAFLDSLKNGSNNWHGQLIRDKLDHDIYLMRRKANPDYNIAFVYPGWNLWKERKTVWKIMANRDAASLDDEILLHKWKRRNHRALLDLAFQELLRKELEKL